MFIPDNIRKCVCFLGYKSNPDRLPILCGSVFFVGVKLGETGYDAAYAVTARHCIEKLRTCSCDSKTYLRVNLRNGGTEDIAIDLDQWRFHPTDETVDAACAPINLPNAVDYLLFPADGFVTADLIEELQIGLGDELFFVGLFKEHSGSERNVPIVRAGIISAMPDEPVVTRQHGRMEAYLVEARSIGGLSGSPVFVHVDPMSLAPEGYVMAGTGRRPAVHYLLGLIHGHWDYEDSVINEDAGANSLNMGIAIVVPCQFIGEVLNQSELVSERESLRLKIISDKNYPAADSKH